MHKPVCRVLAILLATFSLSAAESNTLKALLSRSLIDSNLPMAEVQAFTETRVPSMPAVSSVAEWEQLAEKMRRDTLDQVVFRGKAAQWRKQKTRVEWLDTIEGGPGYKIRKLRYEAVPGLWIPALLYEPETLSGKVPVALNVNGHDGAGKAASYKQLRCINQVKRGMLALNPEWLGMGQLRDTNYAHYRMNQLDLCGTSGLSPFYLAMKRALDILLAHPNADRERVSVSGLSGGGWQTIFISSLDTRVKLSNPVAGYSSFKTRARHLEDLGDSEQTPCDLATVADYAHLTAMMAPRPTLLTYNAKDNCCFASPHALQPLIDAALPIFKLYGQEDHLRAHVNYDPGDHNFGQDNREAFYRMVSDFFYAGEDSSPLEIPSESEIKSNTVLNVELPATNATFHSLAVALSRELPRRSKIPTKETALATWREENRELLRSVVHASHYQLSADRVGQEDGEVTATFWRFKMNDAWTVPGAELSRGNPVGTTIVIADGGRQSAVPQIEKLLAANQRVIAMDPFYFGESKIRSHDYLFALLVAAVGERPLGIQASQVAAVARWAQSKHSAAAGVVAVGPRSSLFALVAAALEENAIGNLELHDSLSSLKQIIENNWGVHQRPELFCFGLLEQFDIPQLAALVAPRQVKFPEKASGALTQSN